MLRPTLALGSLRSPPERPLLPPTARQCRSMMPYPPPAQWLRAASDISIICMPTAAASDSGCTTGTCGGDLSTYRTRRAADWLKHYSTGGCCVAAWRRCGRCRTRLVWPLARARGNPCFASVATESDCVRRARHFFDSPYTIRVRRTRWDRSLVLVQWRRRRRVRGRCRERAEAGKSLLRQ